MGKVIFVILFFAVILFIVYTLINNVLEESDRRREGDTMPILTQFETKIVYTTRLTGDIAPFEEDCRKRGGAFNLCGNICDVDVDACIQVCAYTCEDIEN